MSFTLTGPGGSIQQASRDYTAEYRQRETGPGHMPSLWSMNGVLWGFWAKARLANSNQKSGVLVIPVAVLSKEHIRRRPWQAGETVIIRAVGESYQKLTFTCDFEGCY